MSEDTNAILTDVVGIDLPIAFEGHDARMQFAISEAQRSLRIFFDAFIKPKPSQKGFLLKAKFAVNDDIEHIWLADIDASAIPLKGTIANPPGLKGLSYMQRVTFDPAMITDWMYLEDDYLVGGFTIQVIRSGMSAEERAAHDAATPFKFRD